ncbi:unnamed protein product [Durusdinium trenchii]|uniref:Uncharacterized protein n=2 Tax=Durusdinium trenchii TaxID=1381693 RepID=A0ABP0PXX8_9DINO
MSHKSFDERLSYHVRRFQGKQPRNVLKRYEQRLHVALKSDELQKYAFHVAAWVAELPAEQMCLQYDGLSAVSLLQQYVRSFKQAKPLCEHLTKVLTRVSERLNTDSELGMQWAGLLQDLQHFVPEAISAKSTKAARLMNKALLVWRNTTCETDQEAYVSSLEQSLGVVETGDLCQIRSIFRRAVAALSPPHCTSPVAEKTSGSLLQLKWTLPDLQSRLREVVLRCLDHLDLADCKVEPALQFLKALVARFQELDAQDGDIKIGCKHHWRLLEEKCGLANHKATLASQAGNRKEAFKRCEHGARPDKCRICRPCPHGKVKNFCEKCFPCPHGKVKWNCAECYGCIHGRGKYHCRVCNACVHGRNKYKCKVCRLEKEEKRTKNDLFVVSCSANN